MRKFIGIYNLCYFDVEQGDNNNWLINIKTL